MRLKKLHVFCAVFAKKMAYEPLAKRPKSTTNGDVGAVRIIDIRSDTVTLPTKEMRQAMADAEVGDDVYGEDPSVNRLQDEVASLLGKEAGLFVPSGTMGNLICIMAHCGRRGDEVLLGDKSHISLFEQGGVSQIAGVHPRALKNLPDGTMDLQELEGQICTGQDVHQTKTCLICIENTHNAMGGRVIKPSYMDKLAAVTKKHNLRLHIDGARILNAATALSVSPAELVKHADSVSVCLSKGLGAPVGSVVVGSRDFITQARRVRKSLGGGMRQAGVLAAAGLYGLEHISKRLLTDHQNAQQLAKGLASLKELGVQVDLESSETNIVFFSIHSPQVTAHELVKELAVPTEVHGQLVVIKAGAESPMLVRVLTHHWVTHDDISCTVERIRAILAAKQSSQ